MRTKLSWTLKGELAQTVRRARVRAGVIFAARLSILTLVAGYGFWLLALWYLQPSLPFIPGRLLDVVHWIIIGHAAFWWLTPAAAWLPKGYGLSPLGIGDNRWRWFIAYAVEPHPLAPEHHVVRLWRKDGLRHLGLPLPDDQRTQRLIVRYVARHVPPLDSREDADELRAGPPATPWWFVPAVFALAAAHAVLVGGGLFLLKSQVGIGGDALQLVVLLASLPHLGWLPTLVLRRSARYRRLRPRLTAISLVMTMPAIVIAMATMVILML